MNVLDELGLAEDVKARGTAALESCFRSESGRVLARIDNGSRKYGQPPLNLRRTDLYRFLYRSRSDTESQSKYEKLSLRKTPSDPSNNPPKPL
jgi:2-polyprenyl-6-methoxyphenol hydroxylase-like FAD-dependent oxidoreductase